MAYTRQNSLTLYLQPIDKLPVYQVKNVAAWMVKMNLAANYQQAYRSIYWMSIYKQDAYRDLISWYFEATDYHPPYKNTYDINDYRSTDINYYGEDIVGFYHI